MNRASWLLIAAVAFVLLLIATTARSENCPDLNADGVVNFTDLGLFRQSFGASANDLPACYEPPLYSYSEISNPAMQKILDEGWTPEFITETAAGGYVCIFLVARHPDSGFLTARFGVLCIPEPQK